MHTPFDIGVELGNSKFALCARGEGIVATEAAYLAFRGTYLTENSIVAYGKTAREMYERSHPGIQVVTPMREGIVVDCRVASLLIRHMMKQAGIRQGWLKPKVLVSTLYGASDIERKAFLDVADSVSRRQASIVYEPLAAAHALGTDITSSSAQMVVDVGDGATEALVVARGKTLLGHSMRFGGFDIDSRIIDYARRNFEIEISRSQARRIKERFAFGDLVSLKGISTQKRIPCEKVVSSDEFMAVMARVATAIAEFVCETLSQVSPDMAGDLMETGIHLCGGASRLSGVREQVEMYTGVRVYPVSEPEDAVSQGLSTMLDYKYI